MKHVVMIVVLLFGELAQAGGIYPGSVSQGATDAQMNIELQQLVRQCVQACGQDGYCQGRCLAPLANTQATPRYQQMPEYNPSWPNAAPTTNYACVAAMQRAGYGMGQSMQMCTR